MTQRFSSTNMVPQAPEHNRGAWAKSVEMATRKYAGRATGDVYVITGPVLVRCYDSKHVSKMAFPLLMVTTLTKPLW